MIILSQKKGPPGTWVEIWWGGRNYKSLELDLEITNSPDRVRDRQVLYWSHQFGFTNYRRGGYIGLQLVEGLKKGIFSIWDAIKGISEGSCRKIYEDGYAWRCLIDFDWNTNQRYKVSIRESEEEKNGNKTWIGNIHDYSSDEDIIIGELLIPSSRGRLSGFSVTFIEYAEFDKLDPTDIPYTRASFSNLYASDSEKVVKPKRLHNHYGHGSKPNINSNVIFCGDTTYILEAGYNVRRTTPEDQDFIINKLARNGL